MGRRAKEEAVSRCVLQLYKWSGICEQSKSHIFLLKVTSHTECPTYNTSTSLLHKLAYDHRHIIRKTKQDCGALQIKACGFEFAHMVLRFWSCSP